MNLRFLAPEDQLLLHCCRVELDDTARTAAVQLVQHSLDWEYVLSASIGHGVAPLFHHGLQQIEIARQTVPPAVLDRLLQLYEGNVKRNQRLAAILRDVAAGADRAG